MTWVRSSISLEEEVQVLLWFNNHCNCLYLCFTCRDQSAVKKLSVLIISLCHYKIQSEHGNKIKFQDIVNIKKAPCGHGRKRTVHFDIQEENCITPVLPSGWQWNVLLTDFCPIKMWHLSLDVIQLGYIPPSGLWRSQKGRSSTFIITAWFRWKNSCLSDSTRNSLAWPRLPVW